jgi:hypothetical protein
MIVDEQQTGALAYARASAPLACATLDRQIDNLVYELYDLTPEEIAIVEGAGR